MGYIMIPNPEDPAPAPARLCLNALLFSPFFSHSRLKYGVAAGAAGGLSNPNWSRTAACWHLCQSPIFIRQGIGFSFSSVKFVTGLDTTWPRTTGCTADKNILGAPGPCLSLSLLLCLSHSRQRWLDWSVEGTYSQAMLPRPPAPCPGEVQ